MGIAYNNIVSRNDEVEEERKRRLITTETANTNGKVYRYGEYYFYADKYKKHDHYVQPKFETLQNEVIQKGITKTTRNGYNNNNRQNNEYSNNRGNNIRNNNQKNENIEYNENNKNDRENYNKSLSVSMNEWNKTKESVELILDKMKRECIDNKIDQQECFKRFGVRLYARDHSSYNNRYHIKCGQQISIEHLMSLKFYFDDTVLSSKIRETYRFLHENETMSDIKERHSNYTNICRRLCESIYLFGNELPQNQHVYRGVTLDRFARFDAVWSGPLSTTIDINVAKTFTGGTGSIVKLENAERNKDATMYIYGGAQFCSISRFEKEKEYLMWSPCLKIVDIPFSRNRHQYNIQEWISSMRLFQKLCDGHLLNKYEEKHLLNDDIQNKLNALILWKHTKNDQELIKLIKEDQIKRELNKKKDRNERKERDKINNRGYGCFDLIDIESLSSSSQTKINFIKTLCGVAFDDLLKRTKLIWINANTKLNANLQENIDKLISNTPTATPTKQCEIIKWRIPVKELNNYKGLNNDYLVISGYLRQEIVNNNKLLNKLLCCDEIMGYIGYWYKPSKEPLDFLEYKIKNGNEWYSIVMVLLVSSCRVNNEWYDIHIIVNNDGQQINEHLMWSFDIMCDELDFCMHFIDRKAVKFRDRKYAQIISNKQIKQLIKEKKDIVWKIAFRLHHCSEEEEEKEPLKDTKDKPIIDNIH